MAKNGHVQIGVILPEELATRMKVEAVRRDLNHSELVSELLDAAIPKNVRIVGGGARGSKQDTVSS